jgi:hypothetical protein
MFAPLIVSMTTFFVWNAHADMDLTGIESNHQCVAMGGGGRDGPLHLRHVIGARSAERGLVTHERLPRHFDRVRGGRDRAAVADAR